MQLYKSRGFSEYFGDTFAFLKTNGSHFFKHYFIITGVFLMILLVFGYFLMQFYRQLLTSMVSNNNANAFEEYMNSNGGLVGVLIFVFFIVALVAAVISYAYTPIYLKMYAENSGKSFGTKELVNAYKSYFGKLIIFLLAGLLLGLILIIPIGIAAFVFMITIIGILLLPLLAGLIMLLYSGTLIEYLEGKKGFFDCFGYTWKLVSTKFWAAVGSVGIFYVMSIVIQQVVGLIPYIFGMASMFTTIESGNNDPTQMVNSMTIMMMAVFFISFIVGVVLGTIVNLNQGIVFYSLKEENENIHTSSDIDLIGSGE